MKDKEKVIRTWRMQIARPFGVHLWFDPTVESVRLLSVPTDFICISNTKEQKEVDKPEQISYLGKCSSVSGQAGGAEGGDQKNRDFGGLLDKLPAEPLGFKEDFDGNTTPFWEEN